MIDVAASFPPFTQFFSRAEALDHPISTVWDELRSAQPVLGIDGPLYREPLGSSDLDFTNYPPLHDLGARIDKLF